MQKEWYLSSAESVLRDVQSSRTGLRSDEAKVRLQKYGRNVLESEKRASTIKLLLDQFRSPLVWVLLFALVLTGFLGEWIDFYVILIVVIANGLFGFWQEFKAESSIEALKKLVSLKATVLRDGKRMQIPAESVVQGDIILFETGDKICADARIIDSVNLQTQEASLTGESLPVKKQADQLSERTALGDQSNMVFAGTSVTSGHATAVVTGTGMRTQVGKIAKMLHETPDEATPIQKNIQKLALQLTLIVVLIAVVITGIDLLAGKSFIAVVTKAIALAVAAIPEGLPAVVTISFAIGVQAMANKNALMRRLASVETLGACTVICTDKTGTLTHNQMTVKKLFVDGKVVGVTGEGYYPRGEFSERTRSISELLAIGALNNNAQLEEKRGQYSILGDPTEGALIVSAAKIGLVASSLALTAPRIGEVEFSSERKRMTTIHREKQGTKVRAYTKGAPEIVLKLCTQILDNNRVRKMTNADRDAILKANEDFTGQALRVLGFALKDLDEESTDPKVVEKDMVFVGLQGMIDPPRKEVKKAIRVCERAGIKVIMITGDHLGTAKAVAKDIGLTGKAIQGINIDNIDLAKEVENISLFARVNPEHKLKIIDALRKRGHVVAMTGDGANDAPALKKADLGIAMGITGTDVAREASDMILADDNFSTIVSAVEQGRVIYDNIRKFVVYLLSSNLGEVLTLFTATVLGLIDPLTAKQILWINLVTDLFPATSLSLDPKEPGVMSRMPRDVKEKIITKQRMIWMIVTGVLMMAGTLLVFESYTPEFTLAKAQTMAFTTLVFFQLFNVLNQRSETESAFKIGIFSNKWLIGAIVLSVVLQVVSVQVGLFNILFETVPLGWIDWLIATAVGSSILIFGEIIKMFKKI